jgi:hypothetical protein
VDVTESTGCGGRRGFVRTGLAVALGAGATIAASRQAQAQKLPQAAIMYQPTPKGDQRCDNCLHWQPPNACAIVEGPILAAGWCGAWAPKG